MAKSKQRLSVVLPPEILERAKNCVYWSPSLTLGSLTEAALVAYLDKAEKKNGGPFAERTASLKVGRPLR